MRDAAIRVEGLGKRYRLGMRRERYGSLRERLSQTWARGARQPGASEAGSFWALKDVSCEVARGQTLGVIGANGAGKSTLLKILSRVTEPTEGCAQVRGRVGSLLEVGTGFHPELTGRENVFLNGAILGMKRSEIQRRFDEIVAFAEVEPFIDTPIKRYSSGMYVRLAFAVAAHLDVDVLVVDEVLAVGDAAFQRKCLGKMEDLKGSTGRTVLFVSHNLGAVKLLCDSCLLLDHGRLTAAGPAEEIVNTYLQRSLQQGGGGFVDLSGEGARRGVQKPLALNAVYESIRLVDRQGRTSDVVFEREPFSVELTLRCRARQASLELILVVMNLEGTVIYSSFSGPQPRAVEPGRYQVRCRIDPNILRPGSYRFRLLLRSGQWQDIVPSAAAFRVQTDPAHADELHYGTQHPALMGVVRVEHAWGEFQAVEDAGAVCHA
jgi:lipopolysaccharide transport system ATP-binding protein